MPRASRLARNDPSVKPRPSARWLGQWRRVAAALLLGVGTPVSVAAGWASPTDRIWWLIAAGLCAGTGAWLPLTAPPSPPTGAGSDQSGPQDHDRRGWNIRGPVRSFTGRGGELAALHTQLAAQHRGALVPSAALHGMGGIGKTQLARAYAHQHRDHYRLGWWVPAESRLSITTALCELAVHLGASADLAPAQQLAAVYEALAGRDDWLLVFDNATTPAEVEPFLPPAGGGHVLITSRHAGWQGLAGPVGVDLLPLDLAAELLGQRTGDPDQASARALAAELGRLPLAIEQAAAYATEHRLPLAEYLALFRERRGELLTRGRPLAYEGTVAATVTLSVERLRATAPAAVGLLEVCALLAPDALPVQQLLTEPEWLPEPLAAAARDPILRGETVGALYQAGLLTPDAGDTFRLHRLVQDVVADQLPDRSDRVNQTVELLAALFPGQPREPDTWPTCARLLPHVQSVLVHARAEQPTSTLAYLLSVTGVYLIGRGLSTTGARDLHEQALAIRRQLHEGDHPDTARSLNSLAIDLSQLGEVERAHDLHEQALAMRQRLYQGDHPHLAASLHNLAINLRDMGEVERARDLHEQALAMRQRLYQGDHPDVAAGLGNVAADLRKLGELERARDLHEQALAMSQRLHQDDHPSIATSQHNLAIDLHKLGEMERARDLDSQALAMRQRLYQGDHREIAGSLGSLAADLRALGEADRARELDQQALAMRQRLAKRPWDDPDPQP